MSRDSDIENLCRWFPAMPREHVEQIVDAAIKDTATLNHRHEAKLKALMVMLGRKP